MIKKLKLIEWIQSDLGHNYVQIDEDNKGIHHIELNPLTQYLLQEVLDLKTSKPKENLYLKLVETAKEIVTGPYIYNSIQDLKIILDEIEKEGK